jgi:hypothetical protein
MSIDLPGKPKDFFFEHLILAAYNSVGYYIEHNIVERVSGNDILELDGFATLFNKSSTKSILVECKSSTHGFSDLFKTAGWMKYLNIENGALVGPSNEKDKKDEILKQKGTELGVDLIFCDDSETAIKEFISLYCDEDTIITPIELETWRFYYLLENKIFRDLKNKQKSCPDGIKRFCCLQNYYDRINNGIFFTRNLVDRIDEIYTLYRENVNITAKCSEEISGSDFDQDVETVDPGQFHYTFIDCKYSDLQIAAFLEHKARFTILKNAIEYSILVNNGVLDDRTSTNYKFLGMDIDKFNLLPESFRNGITVIENEPYYYLYPIFWQYFFNVFGGFILLDKLDKEYELISEMVGIPIDQINNALSSYDKLFPNQWFVTNTYSKIRHLKMMPPAFMGLGAIFRLWRYTSSQKYEDIESINQYAIKDLTKWHQCGYEVLSKK